MADSLSQEVAKDCSLCESIKRRWKGHGRSENADDYLRAIFHSHCSRHTMTDETSLCAFCDHLRIAHLFACLDSSKINPMHGLKKLDLGKLQGLNQQGSTCRFCRFISDVVYTKGKALGVVDETLWNAVVSLGFFVKRGLTLNCMVGGRLGLFEVEIGIWDRASASYLQTIRGSDWQPPDAIPTHPKYVDWNQLKKWVNTSPNRTYHRFSQLPQNLKVIDVQQNCVVKAPTGCTYLTLSYVWGGVPTKKVPLSGFFDRQDLPTTIRDALIACDNLGMRYLWVDQLCINQRDPDEQEAQINQMGLIYKCAKCTIVALAGENSLYGLPGVTSPRTWNHSSIEVDDVLLANPAPTLRDLYSSSKWSTRGWTFQEGAFSSTLLYFSDYGAYFEHESSDHWEVQSDAACRVTSFRRVPTMNKYFHMLEGYTQRHFTFSNDILQAFTPILRAAHKEKTFHGIPLQDLDHAIAWYPNDDGSAMTEKRHNFPSWSWTSHIGPIKHLKTHGGLAFWTKTTNPTFTCKPAQGKPWGVTSKADSDWFMAAIALVWREGCLENRIPFTPHLGSSTFNALEKRWPTYDAYWEDAFGEYGKGSSGIFSQRDYETASSLTTSRILVRGQTAHFYLVPISRNGKRVARKDTFWIHSNKGAFAGAVRVPTYNQTNLNPTGPSSGSYLGEFLLLSIGSPSSFGTNEVFSQSNQTNSHFSQKQKQQSLWDQIDDLLYFDDADGDICPQPPGSTLNVKSTAMYSKVDRAVLLNVMLIERNRESNIARRLGVGQIFLKRWTEADRQFKNIILD